MHANAADVGGNNVSINGTTYNTDGLTVAEVLGTQAAETATATTPPPTTPPASSAATTPTTAANGSATASSGSHDFSVHHHHVDHFGHMWA